MSGAGLLRASPAGTAHSSAPNHPPRLRSLLLTAVVGDAGSGGQVLMDHLTFAKVKERLHELGAWDADGLNYRKLASKKSVGDVLCCR